MPVELKNPQMRRTDFSRIDEKRLLYLASSIIVLIIIRVGHLIRRTEDYGFAARRQYSTSDVVCHLKRELTIGIIVSITREVRGPIGAHRLHKL